MRSYPDMKDKYERKEAERLNAEKWQFDLLRLNPSYVHWGPHEDYMCRPGTEEPPDPDEDLDDDSPFMKLFAQRQRRDHGWEQRILYKTWKDHQVELDELNEVVNFYFSVERDSRRCRNCRGTGYHPDSFWVKDSFYEHSNPFLKGKYPSPEMLAKYGEGFRKFCEEMQHQREWHTNITQDEVDELLKHSRLYDFTHEVVEGKGWQPKKPAVHPTADQVNRWARREPGPGIPTCLMGHDGINRSICIEQRCKRLGLPQTCPDCEGHGYIYTAPKAHVSLTYWLLHPRKGCSRGVEVKYIEREDLPKVFKFLREAAKRNAQRFSKVVKVEAAKFAAVKS